MPDWIAPLLAKIALLGFLFAFVRVKPGPRSGGHHSADSNSGATA
jgi:hypothetical protein